MGESAAGPEVQCAERHIVIETTAAGIEDAAAAHRVLTGMCPGLQRPEVLVPGDARETMMATRRRMPIERENETVAHETAMSAIVEAGIATIGIVDRGSVMRGMGGVRGMRIARRRSIGISLVRRVRTMATRGAGRGVEAGIAIGGEKEVVIERGGGMIIGIVDLLGEGTEWIETIIIIGRASIRIVVLPTWL